MSPSICWWFAFHYYRRARRSDNAKAILLLFEDLSGLSLNFLKSRLYSFFSSCTPREVKSLTLNCVTNFLIVTYLVPISGKSPRQKDWLILTKAVNDRLAAWKAQFLSLGGCLILVNYVLSSISTYWMTVFDSPFLGEAQNWQYSKGFSSEWTRSFETQMSSCGSESHL